ncbi:MAG: hypothetical protein RDV48_05360 [Candidatus Eremiobacteraeota bacterium]|nr:hypothetical protein [Candidatus Eremiobacteraeota bacterium]
MGTHKDFSDLIAFYQNLDSNLPKLEQENPCGSCRECCSYHIVLSGYEFDFMDLELSRIGAPFSLHFSPLLPGKRDPRLGEPPAPCPLLLREGGCLVYRARPLACRLMGGYLPYHSEPVARCVYLPHQKVYATVEEIPSWSHYERILRRHPSLPGYFSVTYAPLEAPLQHSQ